ncbi:unnamed protein product [Closterium sp. NIES-54]
MGERWEDKEEVFPSLSHRWTPVSTTSDEGSLEALAVAPASDIAGGRQGAKSVDQDGNPSTTGEQQTGEPVEQEGSAGVHSTGELSKSAGGEESTDSDVVEVPITKPELRRTGRARRTPEWLSFHACPPPAAFTAVYDEVGDDLLYDNAEEDDELPELDPDMHADPEHRWDIATMTVKEALKSWKGEAVKAGMEEEIRSLIGMGTWELVKRPRGVNIMKNWWVLTTKYRLDNTVEHEKARLVVKGFTQSLQGSSRKGKRGGVRSGALPPLDARKAGFGDEAERPLWAELLRSGVAIFDLDYDAILAAMYALSVSAEGDCYLCVPPDPGIEAAALGASESSLPSTARAEALHTFTLDSGASRCFFRDSTTLTPLSAPVPIRLADPSRALFHALPGSCPPCCAPHCPALRAALLWLLSASSRSITRAWLTRDAAARLTIRNHLPLAECAHIGQHKTAQALYDVVVASYSSPATAALGRLLLPNLFPELSAFATVEDLVTHLRTSDARYRAALPVQFLDRNPPPMYITLYFIVTRLPDSLRAVRDHFLALDPTALTADLLEQHLLAGETSVVAWEVPQQQGAVGVVVGAVVGAVAAVGVVAGVGALVAAVVAVGVVAFGVELFRGEVLAVARGSSSSSVGARPRRPSSFTCGKPHTQYRCFSHLDDAWRAEFGDEAERPHWAELLRSGVAIFDLDYDAILAAMYALSLSAEGDCYLCVPGIEAAALGASESALLGTAPAEALHTFTLDSGASRCFFRDSTTLTPLSAPVLVRLADPSRAPVLACSSTVLPCPAGSSCVDLHVYTYGPSPGHVHSSARVESVHTGYQASSDAASARVSASGPVAPPCSCRLLTHQTLLWHHRLGQPSLPHVRGMHTRLLVSGLPMSLPPLPPLPASPCLPCVEGWQRAAPHSSSFPPMTAPLQTLHMDVWGTARVSGQGLRLQLREQFRQDLPVLRLHSDRGGGFSSDLLRDLCRGEGILQTFTLPASPQQNGIAERRIGLVMEVARTSMIHAAAPHFLWSFAVQYTAHQLNLWPYVSLPEISPTLRWTGNVGNVLVFRVWGSRAFVRDTSADKLSACAIPCVFLGFPPDAPGWQFYHPTSRRVFPSEDVKFDEVLLPQPGGAESEGAGSGGAVPGGAEPGGAELAGVEPEGVEPGGAESEGASLRPLSSQQLCKWFTQRTRLRSGAAGARDSPAGDTRAGGAGVTARAGGTGGTAAAGPRGARTRGSGAAGTGSVGGAGAGGAGGGDPSEPGGAGAGGAGAGGTGAGGAGAGGAGARDTGAVDPRAGGAGGGAPSSTAASTAATTAATASPAYCASMASLRVLAFDHEGRPVQFDTWLDDLQLYLLSNIKDGVSLGFLVMLSHSQPSAVSQMRSLWTSQDSTGTVRRCSRSILLPCHCCSRPPASALPVGGGTGAQRVGSGGGQRQQQQRRSETQSPQQLREWFLRGASGGSCPYVIRTGDRASQTCGRLHTQHRCFSRLHDAWRAEFGDDVELPRWANLLRSRIAIFDLDFDAILSSMYALSVSAEGDCYRCVPPDPGIAAAALGASESSTPPGTAPIQTLHTFTLDSGASRCFFRDNTTLTPLPARVPARLADPSGGLVVARSSTVLPCPAVAASCSCRLLSHQTLLWHHRLGHPSLPRLHGMHSRLLVSGLPTSLPPLPPSPAPPCLPCVEGWQRAAPHSSSFPPTTAPLQTLHMDDLPVLRLHFDRGGEFSSNLLWEFCRGEGILQSFTLPDSPQQKGIAECRIGLVMEVARTSMIHAAAPHFLWPFAVRYAAHQLNLWPLVSLAETSPTLRWTEEVGDASVFWVWGSRAFVRNTSAEKLSPRAIPCVFPSQEVAFDESIPFYHLFPYRSAPPSPLRSSLLPVLQGVLRLGVWTLRVRESEGAETGGAETGCAETGGAETGGAETWRAETGGVEPWVGEPGGAEPAGVEPGGAASEGAESGVAEPQGAASSTGSAGALPRISLQQLPAGAGGAGVAAGAGVAGGTATTSVGGARTRGTGAAGTSGVGDPTALALVALELEALELEALAQEALELEALVLEVLELGKLELLPLVALRGRDHTSFPCSSKFLTASPLPAPSPYTEKSSGLTERREPESRPVSPVRPARRVPRSRPPPISGTHAMTLCPSSVPLRVPLPAPPESSLPEFESAATSALVGELLDFAAAYRLDYTTALVAESTSASPPSVRDPDLPDIPTPCSYAEAITGPYSSQWQAAMDAEMASWKSTGAYVDEVPPPGANIVDGMWIFRVKRPPGSPPAFKARYVARCFSQRQGVDYFRTFSPTPKMTTLLVLLHVAAQRDYELHSLDFSTAFLQGSLHEEIWLRRPPGFTESFPTGTQWSLRRPVYGLRQAYCKWHDTLRTTLAALGFAPATADPSLFLPTDTSLPPFYVLVYVDDLVFASADIEALTLVKSELQRRNTCTDLGELRSYLGLQITRDKARRTITLTQSHMVHQVLQRFGFQFSSPQPTPLSTSHSLSAPPLDESVEPSGMYPELVGCLMYLMTCTRPDLVYPLSLLAHYVAPNRHRKPGSPLPAPSPYAEQTDSLIEHREPESRPALPVRAVCTGRRVSRPRPPLVPGTHAMPLRPSSSDLARATSPTVSRLLATVVTDPSFESTSASALVAELVDFAAACRLDYATALVTESESASPPSVGGQCAFGTDVLEERQEDFECLTAAVPCFASMLLAPEGDPDLPDIPTPCSYAEAITGPYSSQWQTSMDAKMASWKSTGTYVDAVPPSGANIVESMWIFRVKRPPGSPPAFKACYVAKGFSQRQGVDYFQTFSSTPKMTTLRVLLHVAAQCDDELHSLDFSTAFLQGSLHEEIWLRRLPGFTGSFSAGPSAPPLGPLATASAATATAAAAPAATAATAAPEYCANMASLRVLAFDHEGRPVAFDMWHDDLQLYLLSDTKDSVSLFDHVSGVVPAPPATADGATRSQWVSRDTTARLAIRNHLPVAECVRD